VLALWIAVLVLLAIGAGALKGKTSNAFSVPGTESQRALNLLAKKFPGTGGATARIVVAAPAGHTLSEPQYRRLIAPTVALARRVPQTVTTPAAFRKSVTVSRDGRIAFADLAFAVSVDKLKESTKSALERVAGPARRAGLQVEFSGGVVSTGSGKQSSSEVLGLAAAFIVLMVTFGALLAAGLPLVTAIVGVAIGLLGIEALTGLVKLNSTAPTLALMLGLAVGIDYALFIVSRHRQQLAERLDPEESVARAVGTAGSAVAFAGLTVVIALAGLTVVGIPFLSVMGLAAAGTIVIAVLIALTLLPALLGFAGSRAGKGKTPRATGDTMGTRWVRVATRRPWLSIAGVIVVLGVIALPALHLRLGLPDAGTKPKSDTERRAYDLLTRGFGPGFNGPLTGVVDVSKRPSARGRAEAVAAKQLATFPDVAAVSTPITNRTGDVFIIRVTPKSGPSSAATKKLVSLLRSRADEVRKRFEVDGLVTGTTAINIDTSDKLSAALPVYLVVVVGLALLLLLLVFRSLAIPVTAVAGFLLTIAAAMGIVVFVFQQGHLAGVFGVQNTSPVISFLPITMIAILFGLAMDYQVFLVSRMREAYVHGSDPQRAVISGFSASARVVTAAAIIMICVFGSFIFGPEPTIKSIGLALAFGVFADAFLVRMTLVPAILILLGHSAWKLPSALGRALPNVDIEGEQLTHHLAQTDAHAEPSRPAAPTTTTS
jgi:RND superfamily putative drug exporter